MNILISGGTGMIGKALVNSLLLDGNCIWILTRKKIDATREGLQFLYWDGKSTLGWEQYISSMDVVINLAGEPLTHWPWSDRQKRKFHESRISAGNALSNAILGASPRPKVFIQASGINHYGFNGNPANEDAPPGEDFLARLTIDWENSSSQVKQLGVRYCVVRLGVVLSPSGGLLPLMTIPIRTFIGGPQGKGTQIVPWIHIDDVVGIIKMLISDGKLGGAFNLVAPEIITNREFNQTAAKILNRPYWFPMPSFLLKLILGEMSVLVLKGRGAIPKRVLNAGYQFNYPTIKEAIEDLIDSKIK